MLSVQVPWPTYSLWIGAIYSRTQSAFQSQSNIEYDDAHLWDLPI